MPVITFSSFVVIPQHALPTNDICETILEWVLGRRDRFSDSPYCHLCECVGGKDNAPTN
jgi:hypothetical protein